MPYCTNCGALNPDKKNFCSKCGYKLAIPEIDEMSYALREFLVTVSSRVQPIDNTTKQKWDISFGYSDKQINSFLQLGLIQNADVKEKIFGAYIIKDLKEMAKNHLIKLKSNYKKRDIIDALLKEMPKDVSESLLSKSSKLELYRATKKGNDIIEKHEHDKKMVLEKLEKDVKLFLKEKDIKSASDIIVEYRRATQILLPTGGMLSPYDWKDGMPDYLMEEASILMNHSYSDLMTDEASKKEISAHIAFCQLMNKSVQEAGDGMLLLLGDAIPCPDLINYCESIDEDITDQEYLAYIYANTKIALAENQVRLKSFTTDICESFNRVEISCMDDAESCSLCKKEKDIYNLSDIESIPVLPRHWGCRCGYMIKESE